MQKFVCFSTKLIISMKKIIIITLFAINFAFGQSITISPSSPEHIKIIKNGTARLDLLGNATSNVSSGNSEINLYNLGTSTGFGPINGQSSINFLNTGNSTPLFKIFSTNSNYMFTEDYLTISSGANNFLRFYTNGSMSFEKSNVKFLDDEKILFGSVGFNSLRTNFTVNSKIGNTHAIFGNEEQGVSIESNWPGISFNGYYNAGRKPLSDGYVGGISMDPTTGLIRIYNSPTSGTQNTNITQIDRVLIDKDGDVGIGNNNPTASLHVSRGTGANGTAAFNGTTHASHFNYSTTEHTFIRGGKDGANVYINDVGTLGNVAIGNGTPTEKLHVFGNLRVSGTICNTSGAITACSDVRYKKNFSKIENPLGKVLSLNGLHYDWRIDEFKENNFLKGRQIGFIAQELEEIFPEMVFTDEKGYKSVDYAKLTPVLVEAMKEQQKMIDDLRKANGDLKNINDKLESRLDKIESILNK